MRNVFMLLIFLSVTGIVMAQSVPIEWSFSAKKIKDGEYELCFIATMPPSWHIYSQSSPIDGGVPTSFTFDKNPLLIIKGKPKETEKPIEKYEEVFGVKVKYFENRAEFIQVVSIRKTQGRNTVKTNVAGNIEYMVCSDERCFPRTTIPFNVKLD